MIWVSNTIHFFLKFIYIVNRNVICGDESAHHLSLPQNAYRQRELRYKFTKLSFYNLSTRMTLIEILSMAMSISASELAALTATNQVRVLARPIFYLCFSMNFHRRNLCRRYYKLPAILPGPIPCEIHMRAIQYNAHID